MNTMYRRRIQLSVVTVAALAIVAVAAVMLLAGGNPAQADTAATLTADSGSGNPSPQATTTPRHATPEPCPQDQDPAGTPAAVVDSGHYALFDVYWNPEEGELTNNPCPPTVVHVPEHEDDSFNTIPARDDRSASNINIDETIIHIPKSTKIDLSTSTTFTKDDYPELWAADKKENRDIDGDGTLDGVGDGMVWALPACPTDGASTGGLCISFSTALLNPADWDGNIEFLLDHVHQIDIDKQDPRYTLAYGSATGADAALWDSSDARVAGMNVAPGGYERPMLFFTGRGTYELQVHIRGNPDTTEQAQRPDGLKPVSTEKSVSSDFREYIIHVGAEADLGVEVSVEEKSPGVAPLEPLDTVTVTVTASNAGPEKAPDTEVSVSLPSGLKPPVDGQAYPYEATKGTYADGVWTIGSMCKPAEPATDDEPVCPEETTLTITAQVKSNTRGQELAAKATISATETLTITETVDGVDTVKEYEVPVADQDSSNDMDTDTITVQSNPNVGPMFKVVRLVPENSPAGTAAGDPVGIKEPDADDELTVELDGVGKGNFAVAADENGNWQITVAEGAHLNYEHNQSYDLVLTVSDGKDEHGNDDPTIDASIPVQISLEDVAETVTATVQATRLSSGFIRWTFTVANPPTGATNAVYRFDLRDTTTELLGGAGAQTRDSLSESFTHDDSFTYASGTYRVEGEIQYDEGGTTHYVHADISGDQTITIP